MRTYALHKDECSAGLDGATIHATDPRVVWEETSCVSVPRLWTEAHGCRGGERLFRGRVIQQSWYLPH